MARTALAAPLALTAQTAVFTTGARDLVLEAGNVTDGNSCPCTGTELVLVRNDDVAAQTVTFTLATDSFGRTATLVETLAAGDDAIFGPFPVEGWRQSGNVLHIDVSDADVKLRVLRVS